MADRHHDRCADTLCLAFLGDVMLGRGVSRSLRQHGPEWLWGDALPVLRAADAVFANLESPITSSRKRWNRGRKMFHFRADPAAVRILECGRVRFVCLANNHILDFAEQGLFDTLEALDAAGIRYTERPGNLPVLKDINRRLRTAAHHRHSQAPASRYE